MGTRLHIPPPLWIGAVVVVPLLLAVACFFLADDETQIGMLRDTAKLLVQLATLVALGALVKYGVDEITKGREKRLANREFRIGLVRRIRSIHRSVRSAPFYIEQEKTVKKYNEQMCELLNAASELKELGDDIRSSKLPRDFQEEAKTLEAAIKAMISYLYSILSEAAGTSVSNWEDVIALDRFSEYRMATLQFGHKSRSDISYLAEYDQHYELFKQSLREVISRS